MDFDKAPPIPVSEYRKMRLTMPGIDGLDLFVRASLDSFLGDQARILIVGAGGGREIETLAPSPRCYRFTAVDTSVAILRPGASLSDAADVRERTTFIQGLVEDVPERPHDGATSLLVMHFLGDDGAKASYLEAIRRRLRPGGPLVLADVSFDDRADLERMRPVFLRHAELAGLSVDKVSGVSQTIANAPSTLIISGARTRELLTRAGFDSVTRCSAVYGMQPDWRCSASARRGCGAPRHPRGATVGASHTHRISSRISAMQK